MEIIGRVVMGLGEGGFYVEKYNKYFLERLGFEAFPGTLNLSTNRIDFEKFFKNSVKIEPEEKGLFPVFCREVVINNKVKGAIVRPAKTSHKKVLEIIAPLNLKEYFNLKEGDFVKVRIL